MAAIEAVPLPGATQIGAPLPTASGVTPPASTVASKSLATTSTTPSTGVTIVDDTVFLTVTVPVDWDEQDTFSSSRDDGSPRPQISAAPDLQQYFETYTGSGLWVVAMPSTTDPADLLAQNNFSGVCSSNGVMPYDDGRFVGQQENWLDCDGGTSRFVNVAARPLDNSFTMFLQVAQATPDDAQLNAIVGSVGTVSGAVYPAFAVPEPLIATGAVPPELLIAPAIPMSTITDDTGRLSIAVPNTWTDQEVFPDINDDGSERPLVAAAPDLDGFFTDWLAPGAQITAFPFNSDPSALLFNLGYPDQCRDGGVQSFNNGAFVGLMQTWTGCGGTTARNVQLAISPADQSATLHIEMELPDADNSPLQAVLSSLPTVPASTVSASTVPASTVPTSTVPTSTVPASTVPTSTVPASTAPASTVPTSTVPASTVAASTVSISTMPPNADNDHLFTSGDIEIPAGEPGQASVVLGNTTDDGDLMIVVRNGRNEAMHGVIVVMTGTDDAGELTFNVIVPIEMVLGPDEWAFGHTLAPNLDQTTNFNVEFFDPGDMGSPVNLEVTDAELRDGQITGNIVNNADVPVVDNVGVHVACFDESQIVAIQSAAVNTETLHVGESAGFNTTAPIDPTTCSSFAIYAGGFPEDEPVNTPTPDTLVASIPETSSMS